MAESKNELVGKEKPYRRKPSNVAGLAAKFGGMAIMRKDHFGYRADDAVNKESEKMDPEPQASPRHPTSAVLVVSESTKKESKPVVKSKSENEVPQGKVDDDKEDTAQPQSEDTTQQKCVSPPVPALSMGERKRLRTKSNMHRRVNSAYQKPLPKLPPGSRAGKVQSELNVGSSPLVQSASSTQCAAETEEDEEAASQEGGSVRKSCSFSAVEELKTVREAADIEEERAQKNQYRQSLLFRDGEPGDKAESKMAPSKRRMVIIEFICTENSYVRDCQQIVDLFLFPCRKDKLLAPRDEIKLFGNIEFVLLANQTLLKDMEQLVMNTDDDEEICMGQTMLNSVRDLFPAYAKYCINHPSSVRLFMDLRKNKKSKFNAMLQERMKDSKSRGLSLDSFLIKPIQRFTKYPLLLKELLHATPKDHADYVPLQTALALTNDMLRKVNESKRQEENIHKLAFIESQINNLGIKLVMRGREFVRDGKLIKVAHGNHQERHFWLFNDVVVYAKSSKKGSRYTFKGFIPLTNARVEPIEGDDSLRHAFHIMRTDTKKLYVLYGKSEEERASWLNPLKKVVADLNGNRYRDSVQVGDGGVAFALSGSTKGTGNALKVSDVSARVPAWKPDPAIDHVFCCEHGGWEFSDMGKDPKKDRYIFLFQDRMLITHKKSAKVFVLREEIDIRGYQVQRANSLKSLMLYNLQSQSEKESASSVSSTASASDLSGSASSSVAKNSNSEEKNAITNFMLTHEDTSVVDEWFMHFVHALTT